MTVVSLRAPLLHADRSLLLRTATTGFAGLTGYHQVRTEGGARTDGGVTLRQDYFDLRALAHRAMAEAGFEADCPPDALREARGAEHAPPPAPTDDVRDLRDRLWSSI